jgi:Ig-like domain CHU_C associated/Secretion system C-terminal sorting domain
LPKLKKFVQLLHNNNSKIMSYLDCLPRKISLKVVTIAIIYFSTGKAWSQCGVTAPADFSVACGSATNLTAIANPVTFNLSTTACSPVSTAGTNAFATNCDDCVTGEIPIGFPFTFFNNVYNTVAISSNGIIGFGGLTFTGFSPFTIPASGVPNNYIAGYFCDIDIRYGGTITYQTIGVAPNRKFVVSYTNVVPYNIGSSAGTGTASFQIVINENGSFQIIFSQLSANWNASNSTAFATAGAENSNGTAAIPVPGRNNVDWPGIVPGDLDCRTFFPVPCTFTRWRIGATQVSTSASYAFAPTATTTYTADWNCGGTTCSANTIVTVIPPTLTMGTVTDNTNCTTANGSVAFNTNLSNGTYTLAYTLNGAATTSLVTVAGGIFTLSNLNSSVLSNFSITSGCTSTSATTATITSPTLLTTTGTTICQGTAGTISSSSCGVIGTTIAQNTNFNAGALTNTDPSWNRNIGGTTCNGSAGTTYYYDIFPFTVSTAGSYTFNGCFPIIDGHASLYQNAFNGANPCGTASNFVIADDDGNSGACDNDPTLIATLATGITYYIISTSFSTNTVDTYSWQFTGPAGATIISGGSGSALQWYTAAAGGSSIGSTTPFNPVGVAGSGLANTNTPGTYTYYAACSASPTCRTATTFVITPQSVAPTSISGTGNICNGTTVTLGLVGGTLSAGAIWQWYSGSCGGTFLGNGTTISVTPTATTTYFVRASAASGCTATACTSGTLTLPIAGTVLANNAESATCVVNQNAFIHFYHSSGRLLASINSLGQNLGNVSVTAYTGTPVDVPSCNSASYMATAMGRRWVITPQFQPATPVDILLPYDQTEFNSLLTQANANISLTDDLTATADLKLSKYSGPLNVDNLASNNCPGSGGSGGTTIHTQALSGNVSAVLAGFSATGRYTRFSIPGFSEFWLHGSSTLSPLSVNLTSFSAKCENEQTKLSWSTASENNCETFTLERGDENGAWKEIKEIQCAGNSNSQIDYEFIDTDRILQKVYYRLTQTDWNGDKKVFDPIVSNCDFKDFSIFVYPNPTKEIISVYVQSDVKMQNAQLELTDFAGKVLVSKIVSLEKGQTLIPFEAEKLASGSYLLIFTTNLNKIIPIKITIQK